MDSLDLDTRLPPRKRLLAGLKKERLCAEFHLPTCNIFARLRDLVNSSTSSPDEIIEASKLAALAAAEAASAARALAAEKAAAAAKAKASAKNALELLAEIKDRVEGARTKHKSGKFLYKSKRPVGRHETDEELAQRLHRSMNSSPRILSNANKKQGSGVNLPNFCSDTAQFSRGLVGKIEGTVVVNFQDLSLDEEEEFIHSQEKHHGSRTNRISFGNKIKFNQKKLPHRECNTQGRRESREPLLSIVRSMNGEQKLEFPRNVVEADAKAFGDGEVSMKITSMLKCKKIKVSQCSSNGKDFHALCPTPTAVKTSAMVPADE